jgi:hypothetical protein
MLLKNAIYITIGLRRYLVGISKNISKSEEKELSVCNTSEVSSEEFDFSIERLSHGIG